MNQELLKLAAKVLSGRLLLTLVAAVVFLLFALATIRGKLSADPDHFLTIVSIVFMSYFNKRSQEPGNGT